MTFFARLEVVDMTKETLPGGARMGWRPGGWEKGMVRKDATGGNAPVVAMAIYKPKACKSAELEALVREHWPTLHECGLATDRHPIIGKSSDGTIVEVF